MKYIKSKDYKHLGFDITIYEHEDGTATCDIKRKGMIVEEQTHKTPEMARLWGLNFIQEIIGIAKVLKAEERKRHCYLGDAVYAEWDGEYFILRTDSHKDEECSNKIYLDLSGLNTLMSFAKALNEA